MGRRINTTSGVCDCGGTGTLPKVTSVENHRFSETLPEVVDFVQNCIAGNQYLNPFDATYLMTLYDTCGGLYKTLERGSGRNGLDHINDVSNMLVSNGLGTRDNIEGAIIHDYLEDGLKKGIPRETLLGDLERSDLGPTDSLIKRMDLFSRKEGEVKPEHTCRIVIEGTPSDISVKWSDVNCNSVDPHNLKRGREAVLDKISQARFLWNYFSQMTNDTLIAHLGLNPDRSYRDLFLRELESSIDNLERYLSNSYGNA